MGGCIRAGKSLELRAIGGAPRLPSGPKRFDVFVSHHQGLGDAAGPPDITVEFAAWIAELCVGLGLKVYLDKTNLARVLDEDRLQADVATSHICVAVVSRAALADPHGMQQELWWAHRAGLPIIPFYDGDCYGPDDFVSWQRDFSFALRRPPVVYRRAVHLRARDGLVAALHDALVEAGGGSLPSGTSDKLAKQAERQRRRAEKADKAASARAVRAAVRADAERRVSVTVAAKPGEANLRLRGAAEAAGDGLAGRGAKRGTQARPSFAGDEAPAAPEDGLGRKTTDKRFRFRDEDIEEEGPKTTGVQVILRSLRDPLGRKEQEQRLNVLQGGGAEEDEGMHVPQHHTLKPTRGILKGARSGARAAGDGGARLPASAGLSARPNPAMEKGILRLLEYLEGVGKDDHEQLPTVLQVLRLTLPNLDVTTRALSIVFEFVSEVARCRQAVGQSGGIKDITAAMALHSASLDCQTYGCGCLFALSCFRPGNPDKDNNSAAIAHAGGIARLVEAMGSFPGCREVQEWGVGALRYLAVDIGGNRREISDGGEVQLTMRGINKRMIAKVGGIEAVVKAMLKFPDDAELQEHGCGALCNLITTTQESKVRAARAGCIRAATTAMKLYPEDGELQSLGCALLRSLALGVPENKIAIVAQGGVRQLCSALARHRGDAEVGTQAVAALCNLTKEVPENKRAIIDAGGLELTVAALRAVPADAELQRQGCVLLHNLACDQALRPQVLAAGGLGAADLARTHAERSVQAVGQILQRQLADEGPVGGDGDPARAGGDGVEGLFAPRRPGGSGTQSMRSKALTRPQKRMMADVLDSMRNDPGGWLPDEDGGAEKSDGDKSDGGQSGAHSARSARSLANQAAAFGLDDLEGLSDGDEHQGNVSFVVRRGLKRQSSSASAGSGASGGSAASSVSASTTESLFVVRRKGGNQPNSPHNSPPQSGGVCGGEGVFSVRRGNASARSGGSNSARQSDQSKPQFEFCVPKRPKPPGASTEEERVAVSNNPREAQARHDAPVVSRHVEEEETVEEDEEDESELPKRLTSAEGAPAALGPEEPHEALLSPVGEDISPPIEVQKPDAISEVGSEVSEGGWIDLEDDGAKDRLERRARRDIRREHRQLVAEGAEQNEGALALRRMMGDDVVVPRRTKKIRIKRSAPKVKFAKALIRVGDAPPERWNDEWEEAVHLRYEDSRRGALVSSARAAAAGSVTAAKAALDGLDGVLKTAKQGLQRSSAVVEGAGGFAVRLKDQGLVQVVQTSNFGRRWAYGLDDDEDSIYGLDELQELGEAETKLLDAIEEVEAKAAARTDALEAATEAAISPDASAHGASARGASARGRLATVSAATAAVDEAARLKALSRKLEAKRDERRRVKLL